MNWASKQESDLDSLGLEQPLFLRFLKDCTLDSFRCCLVSGKLDCMACDCHLEALDL
jgi:hypothetical protein